MYQRYFGFKERPFRLVPDPAYLFMGRSQREAMAHLSYAVRSGDGFAAVIGEVGSGKTTLCRAFLEQLDAGITSAYIFNPPADPVDLMRAVNRDFGLPVTGDRLQDLVDDLNRFLIREKAEGRTALLVIDEAQRLSRQVLEQVRLLSNLETTRSKLLLIVLVGQPELEDTLADQGLRQLRQRITASCRLAPLTLAETGAYIHHRLAVAADGAPVAFTVAAIRVIFGFSRGIPRLINMGCDRALITAYAAASRRIDRAAARQAVRELQSDAPVRRGRRLPSPVLMAALVVAIVALGLNLKATLPTGGDAPPVSLVHRPPSAAPVIRPEIVETADVPQPASWVMDRSRALETVLGLWGLSPRAPENTPADDEVFFRLHVATRGLALYPIADRLDLVPGLNLPALVRLDASENAQNVYGVLAAVQDDGYLMAGTAGTRHMLTHAELQDLWTGTAYVPWRDFYAMAGRIPGDAAGETVLNLKVMLRALGYSAIDPNPAFDAATRRAVIDFQTRLGLPADGVVGPQTKIALYNTRPELIIPMLRPLAPVHRAAPQERY